VPGGTLNLLGEYDFSDEKLRDSVGIRPLNWWTKWGAILGVAQSPKIQSIEGDKRNGQSRLVPLLEFNLDQNDLVAKGD